MPSMTHYARASSAEAGAGAERASAPNDPVSSVIWMKEHVHAMDVLARTVVMLCISPCTLYRPIPSFQPVKS